MADTEVFLDRFPVNEAELKQLLTLNSQYALLKAQAPVESLALLLKEAYISSNDADLDLHIIRTERLVSVEQKWSLTELAQIFQKALQTVFVVGFPEPDENPFLTNTAKLLEAQVSLLGRRGGRFLLRAVFDVCAVEDEDGASADAAAIMTLVQRLVMAGVELQKCDDSEFQGSNSLNKTTTTTMKAWVQSLAPNQSTVSWATWLDWSTNTAPDIHLALSTLFHLFLLGNDHSFRPEPLELPTFYAAATTATIATTNGNKVPDGSALWRHPYDSIPTSLAFMSLGGRWRRLYGSNQDGLSFPTFRQALLSYAGPTVILIETATGDRFGYYSESPWKSCSFPSWYSSDGDSFLFRLHPAWNVYQRNGESSKYMQYLHTPATSYRSQQGSLSGLAVGGVGVDTPRLHLNPSLERCQAGAVDTVFQSGPLLSDDQMFFDVQVLEVFAIKVTDEDYRHGVEAGQLQASIKEGTRQQIAQVDRAQFVDDFKSGAFMNSLYQHRSEARGRHDDYADDEERKGYFVGDKPPSTRNVHRED